MAPTTSAFHLSSFATSHINISVIISTITMFAGHIFLMILIHSFGRNVYSIVGPNTRYWCSRIIHHVLCGSRSLLTIIIQNLLSHHGVLHLHGINSLIHLCTPHYSTWTIIRNEILCASFTCRWHKSSHKANELQKWWCSHCIEHFVRVVRNF